MRTYNAAISAWVVLWLFFTLPLHAQFERKGQKIDPFLTSIDYGAQFGFSLALSADGTTAIIGAPTEKGDVGTALIYTLTSCGWELSATLTGSGGIGGTLQGVSVDLSADGNTAIVGAPKDNNSIGAAWIFAKSGGTWNEIKKLKPSDASGQAQFGSSVALSADGVTAIIGGPGDNNGLGAAWIFRKSGNSWSQSMSKLLSANIRISGSNLPSQGISVDISANGSTAVVGASGNYVKNGAVILYTISGAASTEDGFFEGAHANYNLGYAVAISNDGNTAIAGMPRYDNFNGGIVVLARFSNVWSVQASDQLSSPSKFHQGMAVALSADGNTAIIGGGGTSATPYTNGQGQTWVMTRSGSVWSEEGRYVGFPSSGNCQQGSTVAISGDGKSFLTAGYADNNNDGAAWFFSTKNIAIPQPSLAQAIPMSAAVGETVTLTGSDLSCVTEVRFGDGSSEIVSKSATSIVAKIKTGCTSGDICVFAPGGKDCISGFTLKSGGPSPTSIAENETAQLFSLYPNPATQRITLKLTADVLPSRATIRDMLGRQVLEMPLTDGRTLWEFDLSALPAGMYVIQLTADTIVHSLPFTKQ